VRTVLQQAAQESPLMPSGEPFPHGRCIPRTENCLAARPRSATFLHRQLGCINVRPSSGLRFRHHWRAGRSRRARTSSGATLKLLPASYLPHRFPPMTFLTTMLDLRVHASPWDLTAKGRRSPLHAYSGSRGGCLKQARLQNPPWPQNRQDWTRPSHASRRLHHASHCTAMRY